MKKHLYIFIALALSFLDLTLIQAAEDRTPLVDADKVPFKKVSVIYKAALTDNGRPEASITRLVTREALFPGQFPESKRKVGVQIFTPASDVKEAKFPVILYSNFMNQNYGTASITLTNLASRGYVIVNIDHYFARHTEDHGALTDNIKLFSPVMDRLFTENPQENVDKEKRETLNNFSHDILFVLNNLKSILAETPSANISTIGLMGGSAGHAAMKKVVEILSDSGKLGGIRAMAGFDPRLNQLGLRPQMEIPTLVLGSETGYAQSDPLRVLPTQKNLQFKVLPNSTHISVLDFAIAPTLGLDTSYLMKGRNALGQALMAANIEAATKSDTAHFMGERPFLGSKQEFLTFLSDYASEVDSFFKKYLK